MTEAERADRILKAATQYPNVAAGISRSAPNSLNYGTNAILGGAPQPWAFEVGPVLAYVEGAFERAGVDIDNSNPPGAGQQLFDAATGGIGAVFDAITGGAGRAADLAEDAIEAGRETTDDAFWTANMALLVYGAVGLSAFYVAYKSGIAKEIGKLLAKVG